MSTNEEKIGHLTSSIEHLSKDIDKLSQKMGGLFKRDEDAMIQFAKLNEQMKSHSAKIDNLAKDMIRAKGIGLKMFMIVIGASSAAGAMGSSVSGWFVNMIKIAVE